MVAKRWKMEENMGEEYVVLPFLADEELISISKHSGHDRSENGGTAVGALFESTIDDSHLQRMHKLWLQRLVVG